MTTESSSTKSRVELDWRAPGNHPGARTFGGAIDLRRTGWFSCSRTDRSDVYYTCPSWKEADMIALANPEAAITNAQLIERCGRGDQEAWNVIIDRFVRLVYSIPNQYGMCEADADDVFQNVFIALRRQMSTIRDAQRLSAWLSTTAHRECWRIGRTR